MKNTTYTCDKCKNAIRLWYDDVDEFAYFNASGNFGFGSKFDGYTYNFHLCDDCYDLFNKWLKEE